MKKYFLYPLVLVLVSLSSFTLDAKETMRRCMLLPIQDSVGGAIGFEVFKEIENYLKTSDWCYYESNSPILDILANYRQNLKEHLENPEVLKVISERTRAGSLIRVNIESMADRTQLNMSVIGSNGEDHYYKNSENLETNEVSQVSRTVRNWLDEYRSRIPYDGRVVGVLGDQFIFEVGGNYGVLNEQRAEVVRPISKQKHPLLEEVVDWETERIAKARVFQVSANQSQARVTEYEGNKKVQSRDWVILQRVDESEEDIVQQFEVDGGQSFGQLGEIGVAFVSGRGTSNINDDNESKKMRGYNFGVHVDADLWITRNYWVGLEVGRTFGSYSPQQGEFESSSNSLSASTMKVKAGYKYLPMGFFYGPQVDAFIGYARYGYGFDNSPQDRVTAARYAGMVLGARGSIPVHEKIRVKLELDFIFKPSFKEDINNFGGDDSVSNYNLKFGGSYQYQENMTFDAMVDFLSNKTKFNSGDNLDLKDTKMKFGVTFNF